MKILELQLHAFGPFTDRVLDFSAGREGLHLVMGPNEAGKSSALRALKQALFKIPVRSTDDFVHAHPKLKVGLRLRNADGREMTILRRKGSNNTLVDEDGKPVAESQLALLLNGLSESAFCQRFALDHDELVRGGRSIVDGKGELGELLFQAAGGVHDLLETRKRMRLELEELFKPSGSKPRINARIAELKQMRELARERSLPSARWLEHDGNQKRAKADLREIERELSADRAQRHRLKRLLDAIPLFNKRISCRIKYEELSAVPILDEDFSERRDMIEKGKIHARAALDAATRSLGELDSELNDLTVPETLLADADRIEQLRESQADFRKLSKSLPRERETLRSFEVEVRRTLTELEVQVSDDWLAAARSMRLGRSQKNAIKVLGREHADRSAKRAGLTQRIVELESQISAQRGDWNNLRTFVATDALATALAEAHAQGDLEKQVAEARTKLERLASNATSALARLPVWSGSLDVLASLPIPASQTIERFEADHAAARLRVTAPREKIGETRQNESHAQAELERLRQSVGALPSEDDLIAARQHRDALWVDLRSEWNAKPTFAQQADRDVASVADDYEQAVIKADALADRLRREAGRVAEQAAARSKLDQARRGLTILEAELAEAVASQAVLEADWSALWAPLGITPLSPREMQAWLGERRELLRLVDELHDHRDKMSLLENMLTTIMEALVRTLQSAGETGELAGETLPTLKRRAEKLIKRVDATITKRDGLGQSIAALELELDTTRGQLRALDEQIATWHVAWTSAVAPLGLDARATPEQADAAIEQIDDLMSRLKDADAARTRLEALERDRDRFARILGDDAPASSDGSVDLETASTKARDMIKEYDLALKLQARRDGLLERREQEQAKVKAAALELERLEPRLAELCREAQVSEAALLPLAERQSREARTLRGQLADLEEQLTALAGHETLESFETSARAVDVDQLPDQIAALDQVIMELEETKDGLNQTLGRERSLLGLMNGGDAGALAAQQAEALVAQLAQDVEDYARIQLAARVLDQVVERYREKNQGPVLQHAGDVFSRLTLGAFTGLRGVVEDGRYVLQAVRAGSDEPVVVAGLSEGTADQLFLALRLASLEIALENQAPLPLLLDDVLIQFDDRRALAALSVLAELSTRTQIVLFTHHEHLVALAKARLDPKTFFIHYLP